MINQYETIEDIREEIINHIRDILGSEVRLPSVEISNWKMVFSFTDENLFWSRDPVSLTIRKAPFGNCGLVCEFSNSSGGELNAEVIELLRARAEFLTSAAEIAEDFESLSGWYTEMFEAVDELER